MARYSGAVWLVLLILGAPPADGQHQGHVHPPPDTTAAAPHERGAIRDHGGLRHVGAQAHPAMPAFLGPYTIGREASGTSWQPEASPHRALHNLRGPWSLMLHGYAHLVADRQGGPRGQDKLFANQMVMGMASRPIGPARLGLRVMFSGEPATIGKRGYPLLLQTGETADGVAPLIDRQHPHDLFMELAATVSVSQADRSAFIYAGLPGEPALGPPVFMHRFSGESFPEAPIAHHWLDSSHITFGVLTAGVTWGPAKLDASLFRGREPDQERWNIEPPKLDSHALRLSWNPRPAWALQASRGRLESPEQLEPDEDVDRTTASVIHHHTLGGRQWQTTLAWGRNDARPGRTLDAWMLESALELRDRHTLLARAERVEKDELFAAGDPRHGRVFAVGKLGLGYLYEGWQTGPARWGAGALGTVSVAPAAIQDAYGDAPVSGMGFVQVRLRRDGGD